MSAQDVIRAIDDLPSESRIVGPLDEVRVLEYESFFNHMFSSLPPGEGVSTLWFDEDTSANGAVNRDGADAVLHCDASANEHAQLETTERVNYTPGSVAAGGWAIRPSALPSGEQDLWAGMTNGDDGVGVGIRVFSTGEGTPGATTSGVQPYVFFERDSNARIRIPQEHWNVDTLDGSGDDDNPSNADINDFLDGVICRVDPQLFYGHGVYEIGFVNKSGSTPESLGDGQLLMDAANAELLPAHRFVVTGETMLEQPNVPITVRAETNGTAEAINFHYTAAHYERARGEADTRLNGERRAGVDVDAAWEPLISWRKRTGWEQVNVRPVGVVVASDTDLALDLQLGTDLGMNASFGSPTHTTSSEHAVEVDTSATSFSSTGERRWVGQVTGGQGANRGQGAATLEFNLPANRIVTLAAKADAANATVDAVVLWGSEF